MEPVYKISQAARVNIRDKRLVIKDITGNIGDITYVPDVDAPDVYNDVINTTGYDGTNRSDVALYLVAFIKTTKGDVSLEIEPYFPLTVTEFFVKYTVDGWYAFHLIVVPVVTSPSILDYLEGQAVYNTSTQAINMVVNGVFASVSPEILVGSLYDKTYSDRPVLFNTALAKAELNKKITDIFYSSPTQTKEMDILIDDYNMIRGIAESADYEFSRGNKYIFAKSVEYLNSNFGCISK